MRIVVSGTHASGKSTLISDFALARPEYVRLDDPFDDLLDEGEIAGVAAFLEQLQIASARLSEESGDNLIAERGPLDFLAYLLAWQSLGRADLAPGLVQEAIDQTRTALRGVDLLVVLPLDGAIGIPGEEDPALRTAMDRELLDLVDDPDLMGECRTEIVVGDADTRLRTLRALVGDQPLSP